ncbi:Leucine-responsive regulatory protein [Kiritimatiella glycovorans]|uniref:Leucine-responsive regulatory protein n=2 Tax=Kiritimatiella glycovorans TaxID=1307763 RepID=A0A0G3EFW3_9BACT|nr:Leucine-responsive regulatory protein [Kiritimatiella glycovorans]
MDELLRLLQENALETPENLAQMLDTNEEDVRQRIADYEQRGIIRGYQAVIDEDRLDVDVVTAVIEVKITPQREHGFNEIAERISRFPEVQSLFLMSGAFDLLLFVTGRTLHEVALFVSDKLATIEGINSTATHFMLKTYKQNGVLMHSEDEYERLQVSP